MHHRYVLGAAIVFGLPCTAVAQTSPLQRPMPTIKAPVEVKQEVEVKTPRQVQTPSPIKPSAVATPLRTERANTALSGPHIRVYSETAPTSRYYFVHYYVPNIAQNPASQLIVERQGKCGWTTSSFDGSKTPEAPNRENCAELFELYSKAVARLANSPPANRNYYELRISKQSSLWGRWLNNGLFDQPVMAVSQGPGARVTRYRLNPLPATPRPDTTAVRVDNDRDGFAPISAGGIDCDDNDASRFPGNVEVPNSADEDCDPDTIGTLDRDGDGFTDASVSNPAFGRRSRPLYGRDCDDRNPGTHPNAPEVLNDGIDNNCDGAIDQPAR